MKQMDTPHIDAFINESFKRINTLHVMHRASLLSAILFVIYIIDNPDPFYFFFLFVFLISTTVTRSPQRYFKFTMKGMSIKPLKDMENFVPVPSIWLINHEKKTIRKELFDELNASLTLIPNTSVVIQINKIIKSQGHINHYDLLNLILLLLATDKYLYNQRIQRFNVKEILEV